MAAAGTIIEQSVDPPVAWKPKRRVRLAVTAAGAHEMAMMRRRTKILATIGPASRDLAVLDELMAAGLDSVRLNFSHGTQDSHAETYHRVREAADRHGHEVALEFLHS